MKGGLSKLEMELRFQHNNQPEIEVFNVETQIEKNQGDERDNYFKGLRWIL